MAEESNIQTGPDFMVGETPTIEGPVYVPAEPATGKPAMSQFRISYRVNHMRTRMVQPGVPWRHQSRTTYFLATQQDLDAVEKPTTYMVPDHEMSVVDGHMVRTDTFEIPVEITQCDLVVSEVCSNHSPITIAPYRIPLNVPAEPPVKE